MEKEIVYLEKNNRLEKSNFHGNENIGSVLQSNPLFSTLPQQEIDHLTGYLKVCEFSAGENIFRQGNEGAVMYVLIEGLLHSTVEYDGIKTPSLNEQIQPGEHFGEESILGPNKRSATVSAVTECLVIEIPGEEVMEVARRNGTFFSLLNQGSDLSKFKKIQGKHKGKESSDISTENTADKKPLSSSIQTFFTDLFPSSTISKK